MATLGELIVKIGADARNFTKGLNDSTKQLNKWAKQADKSFGPVMDGIQTGLTAVGATAAVGFGGLIAASIKGASGLEGYRNTLNTVMKDQVKAGETMAWAVDFANKTPFETDSVVQATVRLQAYGLEAQKVLPAIGDMASVMNKDIMQAVEAVADAQTGELERLKEFGITKAMIVEQGNKIMRGVELVNNKGQITDQDNFNKALLSLMDERYKGGMEIQANSLKGLWSTVTGVFKTTIATMAGISKTGEVLASGLFEKLKAKIKGVTDKLTEWEKNGKLQEWADKAGKALSSFWNVGEKIFDGLMASGKWIIDNWGLIGPILAGILAGFMAYRTVQGVIKAITIAQGALNLVMAANPIGLVIIAIGALVAAGVYLYRNWDTVKAKLSAIWDVIGAASGRVAIAISTQWNVMKLNVYQAINGLLGAIAPLAKLLPASMAGAFENMRAAVNGKVNDVKNNLDGLNVKAFESQAKMGMAFAGVSTAAGSTAQLTQAAHGKIATSASSMGSSVQSSTQKAAKGLTDMGKKAEEAAEKAKKAFEVKVKKLDDFGEQVTKALKKRYEEQEKIQIGSLDKEVERVRKATDVKIKLYEKEYQSKLKVIDAETASQLASIQAKIDDINNVTGQEEKALQEQEYQKQKSELEKKLTEAESADERAKIQEDLNDLVADHDRDLLLQQRQDKIEAYRKEMDDIRTQAEDKKQALEDELREKTTNEEEMLKAAIARLENEREEIKKHYAKLTEEENIQAAARKLALDKNNTELIDLLKTYNPQWQNEGQSFGESLLKGLNSTKASIQTAVNNILSLVKSAPKSIHSNASITIDTAKLAEGIVPQFAKGGIVPGPVGAPQLAMVHGGEEVRTIGQQKRSGINIYITGNTISNTMDIDEIGDRLVRRLRREGVLA